MKRFVVLGFMGSCPIAGVIWQHIHYIAGLQRLGYEAFYVEDTGRYPYNPVALDVNENYDYATSTLAKLGEQFNFRWCYVPRHLPGRDPVGLSRKELLQLYCEADALLNICGSHELNEDQLQNRCLIYIESDPGVEQIKVDKGDRDTIEYLKKHHALFTFGENVGTAAFPVPTHGFHWQRTRQPVVTDFWRTTTPPPQGAVFTSIANWSTAGLKDIEWRGERYLWSKSLEFLKFIEAPQRAGELFELAMSPDAETAERFGANNWRLTSAEKLSIDHEYYKSYIQNSKGEFTVAKDQYVRLNTGWFSDRSACYLAAGRPVITQETGANYEADCGLLPFRTMDDIVEAVRRINADYEQHSRAAYRIAHEYFEAEKVLASVLERAGC